MTHHTIPFLLVFLLVIVICCRDVDRTQEIVYIVHDQ